MGFGAYGSGFNSVAILAQVWTGWPDVDDSGIEAVDLLPAMGKKPGIKMSWAEFCAYAGNEVDTPPAQSVTENLGKSQGGFGTRFGTHCVGFRVQGLELGVRASRFRVWGGFKVQAFLQSIQTG